MTIGAIEKRASQETRTIEKLAAALEKASTVNEIKDVRDRAMAIQLYTRKKKGGLVAAQAAGRVVTQATLMLAKLYAEEQGAKGGDRKSNQLDRPQVDLREGKVAIARAAEMDPSALSRLAPVVDASKSEVKAAVRAIEERGDVVTPNALLREIAPPAPAPQPRNILGGRDPTDFKTATGALGRLSDMSEYLSGAKIATILRGCDARERRKLAEHARVIYKWTGKLIEEVGHG